MQKQHLYFKVVKVPGCGLITKLRVYTIFFPNTRYHSHSRTVLVCICLFSVSLFVGLNWPSVQPVLTSLVNLLPQWKLQVIPNHILQCKTSKWVLFQTVKSYSLGKTSQKAKSRCFLWHLPTSWCLQVRNNSESAQIMLCLLIVSIFNKKNK